MRDLTILIPAAGSSSRMQGADKLLEAIDSQPLLRRQAQLALTQSASVIVTLRAPDPARQAALRDLPVTLLHIPDAATGMSASLRGAAVHLGAAPPLPPARGRVREGGSSARKSTPPQPGATESPLPLGERVRVRGSAVMILPADMPDLTADDLATMIDAFRQSPNHILRGCSGDTPGHPVILPADLIPELLTLSGDEGARSILQRHRDRIRLIALPGRHALTDLDTPEDWAAWWASHQP